MAIGRVSGSSPLRSIFYLDMQTELEAKFLDVDSEKIRAALEKSGAKLIHVERLMRRRNFDFPDRRLYHAGGWVRVRDEGDKTTLSYKLTVDDTLEGTKELCVTVDDFDKTSELLLAIGMYQKSYQETKRERWDFEGIEVTIDTWPWIPTFVEIEGGSEQRLKTVAAKLGLDWGKAVHGAVAPVYCLYYDVTVDEVNGWPEIKFVSVPDWLEKKRRKR
jgi:adenylate cyclase, class 2